MPNDQRLTLNDIQYETERFLTPSTEKERDILSAAVALLSERGIDGATTAEIAKRGKVTERTLFRYFPSKRDLVRRVLAPVILRTILTREWKPFGALLENEAPNGKDGTPMFTPERLAGIATNPALARALLGEMTRNIELRDDLGKLWHLHFWKPMMAALSELKAKGALRKDVDIEALVWAIDCLNIGYLFLRNVYATNRKWDDAHELEKMADILLHGSADETHRPAKARAAERRANGASRRTGRA